MHARRHLPLNLLGSLIPLLLAASAARADTRTVTNLLDTGPGSLRDTIAAAQPGDVIDFMPGLSGTITLASPIASADLTISGPGASLLTISGGNVTALFSISGATTLEGLTLTEGYATTGTSSPSLWDGAGVVSLSGGPHTIRDCRIVHNSLAGLNAITVLAVNATVTIERCTVTDNAGDF